MYTVGARQINAAENLNKPDAALERQISKLHPKIIGNNSWDSVQLQIILALDYEDTHVDCGLEKETTTYQTVCVNVGET